jgi:hypothetical protein
MKFKSVKNALLATAVTAASLGTLSTAQAATLNVDVDITLPEIIILYAYTDIDLDIAADQLGPLLEAACTSDDCEIDLGTKSDTLAALGTTLDLDIASDIAPVVGANPTITLDNSWGVRGIGFANYDESIAADVGNEVLNLVIEDLGAPSLAVQTGSVSFDLDLSNPDFDNDGFIEANYTITVVGS